MKSVFISTVIAGAVLVAGSGLAQETQKSTATSSQSREMARLEASPATAESKAPAAKPTKHKVGPFDISINWRTRVEGWNWFQGNTGNSDYPLWHSLVRVGVGQDRERFAWFVEGETASRD